jgi:hypothetical protein
MMIQSSTKGRSTKTVIVTDAAFTTDDEVADFAMKHVGETPARLTFMGANVNWIGIHTAVVTMHTD